MQKWRELIHDILKEHGDAMHLNDIHKETELRGSVLGRMYKSRVRAVLEENSSDSKSWNGNYDLFEMVSKGSGLWRLRSEKITRFHLKKLVIVLMKKEIWKAILKKFGI